MGSLSLKKLAIALIAVGGFFLVGCGEKDVDPQAKVDAPGYYNGPMKKRGGEPAANDQKADPAKG